jgi:hypothetical protein
MIHNSDPPEQGAAVIQVQANAASLSPRLSSQARRGAKAARSPALWRALPIKESRIDASGVRRIDAKPARRQSRRVAFRLG